MADEDLIRNIVREIVRHALTETPIGSQSATPNPPSAYHAPWTGVEYEAHPSRLQFDIAEAASSSNDLLEFVESKLCSIEKNKSCDHCGLCRNLGF